MKLRIGKFSVGSTHLHRFDEIPYFRLQKEPRMLRIGGLWFQWSEPSPETKKKAQP